MLIRNARGPRTGPCRARLSALALLGQVVLATGCATDDGAFEVVHRLADELGRPPRPTVPRACALRDEIRPSLGCLAKRLVFRRALPRSAAGTVTVDVPLPPALAQGPLILEPAVTGERAGVRHRLPPTLVPRGQAVATTALDVSPAGQGAVTLTVHARPVPGRVRRFVTRRLDIPPDAELSVGLGVQSFGAAIGSAPVEFLLTARMGREKVEVLREVLDPASAEGWVDRRTSLGRLAGRSVRFVLSTRPVPRAGPGSATAPALPLWGAPLVVARRSRGEHRNVILISLDTLRADHVGTELSGMPLTPRLDEIAAGGTRFEQAIAPAASTTASHMSLFTAAYPIVHRVGFVTHRLSAAIRTLPELLAARGWVTAAVTEDGMLAAESGFARGFDFYREHKGADVWDARGQVAATFGAGARWVERHRDDRIFLFLHTYQVHAPYVPPPEFDVFRPSSARAEPHASGQGIGDAADARARYAGEVRYTDAVLQELFERLARLGILAEAIVVVISDHGEAFGEHGAFEHGTTLYDEVLRVPVILWAPGLVPAGVRIAQPVSLVDVMPTLLDLVGVAAPAGLDGASLGSALGDGRVLPDRTLFAETGPQGSAEWLLAARTDRFKWIARGGSTSPGETFDLHADPAETRNLDDPALRRGGENALREYRARAPKRERDPTARGRHELPPAIDAELAEKLRALGYIQ